ncbi:putative nuclease HARBI1 isoform X1 [Spodoptera frugiperda]|uniref:Putative nuclease HARBI1 n=1 Tax=Spodoptera frugiperda TaxID=7108 RepID=A0A9R0E201_SPOFR|nr:putative nuclease HARBI1 isoform X1 [Spodoptera frugiperda]
MDLNIIRYFDSESESSSDDDFFTEYVLMRRPKIFRQRNPPLDTWDDLGFCQRYRLSKAIVMWLLNLIGCYLKTPTTRNHAISPLEQILLTLRFYATGTMQQCSGDFFGISKSAACKIIHLVSRVISTKLNYLITMPHTPAEIKEVVAKFYSIAKFPSVVGAIDCTHIRIISPGGENAELYRNRKDVFSINVQVVADADLKIRNIVARWPGSVHDSTIFNNSRVKHLMNSGQLGRCCLLGDRGYGLKQYLLTPLADPRTAAEKLYNESQIRTRNVVERTFGVWKRRFPCIGSQLRVKLENVQPIIVSTAILHNICIMNREDLPTCESVPDSIESESNIILPFSEIDQQYRGELITTYFSSLLNSHENPIIIE